MRVLICVCITLVLCAVGVTNAWLLNKPTNLVGRATGRWGLGSQAHRVSFSNPPSKYTMKEPENISDKMSKLSATIKSWNTRHPSSTEIFEITYQLDDCADDVAALVIENKTLQSQIENLRIQLSVEISRRERLEKQVRDLRLEHEMDISVLKNKVQDSEARLNESEARLNESETRQKESDALLKLFDLCYMFNFYTTKPAVTGAGFSSNKDFVSTYTENKALVLDGDLTENDFNLWLKPVRDALGGIDIEQLISVCRARHAIAHVDLGAKVSQQKFLLLCKSFDFGSHNEFASRIIEHLSTVPLKRMN
jgi:hypothetical protein